MRRAIILILAVSLVGIVVGFYFYFKAVDNLSAENMRQRVLVALEVEAGIQQEILEEYSFWDEAYENCIESVNREWIHLNTGNYLFTQQGIDFSLAVNSDGVFTYIDAADRKNLPDYTRLLGPKIGLLLKKSPRSTLPTKVVSDYITMEGDFFLVSAGPFIDETTRQVRSPECYLVFGKKIDSAYIKKVGTKFKLPGLDFKLTPDDRNHSLPVVDQDSRVIGHMVWEITDPSRKILPVLIIIVCAFYIITGGICVVILRREAGNIREHEEQLYFMATKDYLTGISNRRHVMELGQNMLATHQRYSRKLSVLILDIDFFKRINDEFGHETGDLALSSFSRLCAGVLRSSDLFGRFGGEEFIAVLHDTGITHAVEVAERMRKAVEDYSAEHHNFPAFTVSIGVAIDSSGDDFDAIINKADEALLKAKAKGRNRVEVYEDSNIS